MTERVDDEELMKALLPFRLMEGRIVGHQRSGESYRIICFFIVEAALPKIEIGFTYKKVGLNDITFSRPLKEINRFIL